MNQNIRQAAPPEPALIKEKAVSEKYNLGLPFLRNARWKGTGPRFYKISSMVFYKPEDVENWINSQGVSSTTEASVRRRES